MKNLIVVLVVMLTLCMASTSMATSKFDSNGRTATAWSPAGMHSILTNTFNYPILHPERAPKGYVKEVNGKLVFGEKAIAWAPFGYHQIFMAYGLSINTDRVFQLDWIDYCRLVNQEIVWAKGSFAYSPRLLVKIVGIYDPPPRDDDKDGVINKIDECPNTPFGAVVDERGCWVLNGRTMFEFDSSEVRQSFMPELKAVAKVFSYESNSRMTVILGGHTDSIGSKKYNLALSERRANSVAKVLVGEFGVDIDRIDVVGYGELDPIAPNDTAEGRQLNRRVELVPIY